MVIHTAIGASHVRLRAEALGRRARLRPPEASYSSGAVLPLAHLISREQEVLQLMAEVLTDRQIGARLFISHRTVERHVSNLLAKLAATRRAELPAVAHRPVWRSRAAPGWHRPSGHPLPRLVPMSAFR